MAAYASWLRSRTAALASGSPLLAIVRSPDTMLQSGRLEPRSPGTCWFLDVRASFLSRLPLLHLSGGNGQQQAPSLFDNCAQIAE
jgi:hypothetical protein